MKNETLHCQLIHLHKSLSRDVNLKSTVTRRNTESKQHSEAPRREAEESNAKISIFYRLLQACVFLNCPFVSRPRMAQYINMTYDLNNTAITPVYILQYIFFFSYHGGFLGCPVKISSPTNHLAVFNTHGHTQRERERERQTGSGDLVTMINTSLTEEAM